MKFPYYSLAILVILYHISIGICMMLNFHQLEDKRLKDILDTASLIFAIPSCRIDFPNFLSLLAIFATIGSLSWHTMASVGNCWESLRFDRSTAIVYFYATILKVIYPKIQASLKYERLYMVIIVCGILTASFLHSQYSSSIIVLFGFIIFIITFSIVKRRKNTYLYFGFTLFTIAVLTFLFDTYFINIGKMELYIHSLWHSSIFAGSYYAILYVKSMREKEEFERTREIQELVVISPLNI